MADQDMDFLDPDEKRKRGIRLAIGYLLMAVLIGGATAILVLQAYGFDLDRKTGNVIQNGLVYLDSTPGSADIYINGVRQKDKTNARLPLPEGKYSIELKKPGYRTWQRNLVLEGGIVERFEYPLLIPDVLSSVELQTDKITPMVGLQSPDRHYILLSVGQSLSKFVQYDLSSLKNNKPAAKNLSFPAGLFKKASGPHKLELVEWSSDNKHVLLKHSFASGQEFLILNRDNPATSVNINQQLEMNPDKVVLLDKKPDKLYLYFSKNGSLRSADLKTKLITPQLSGVISFKAYGAAVLEYSKLTPGKKTVEVDLKMGKENYILRSGLKDRAALLDIAKFEGTWFAVVADSNQQKTYIYRNPQDTLKQPGGHRAPPIMVLKLNSGFESLSFSQNARMILVNNGQHFAVYDVQTDRNYRYTIPQTFDKGSKPAWMDDHRLINISDGKIFMFDFDGSNKQMLVSAAASTPVFFDRDYKRMYNQAPSGLAVGKTGFMQTNLRLDQDL